MLVKLTSIRCSSSATLKLSGSTEYASLATLAKDLIVNEQNLLQPYHAGVNFV
jgi:hypothetical protein